MKTKKREEYLSWDEYFMGIAKLTSGRSKDPNTQVGACIVSKNNRILSTGYNGTPNNFNDDDFPWAREGKPLETKYMYVCHAEANAITKLARSTQSSEGATLYCTDMPCVECSKLIIQAGIVRVVYERPYRITDGVELLKRAGIQVDNIPSEEIETNIMWDEEFVRQKYEICDNCGYDACNGNDHNCPKLKKKK